MTHLKCFVPEPDVADETAEDAFPTTSGQEDNDGGPGSLLADLERRQDHVLEELDKLNKRIEEVLIELGVRLDDDVDEAEAPQELATSDD